MATTAVKRPRPHSSAGSSSSTTSKKSKSSSAVADPIDNEDTIPMASYESSSSSSDNPWDPPAHGAPSKSPSINKRLEDLNVFDISDIIGDEYIMNKDAFKPVRGTGISTTIPHGLCSIAAKLVGDGVKYKQEWAKLVISEKIGFGQRMSISLVSEMAMLQELVLSQLGKADAPHPTQNNVNILIQKLKLKSEIKGLTFGIRQLFVLYVFSWYHFMISLLILESPAGSVYHDELARGGSRLKHTLIQARSMTESNREFKGKKKEYPVGVTRSCMFSVHGAPEAKGGKVYDVILDSYRFPAPVKETIQHTLSNGIVTGKRVMAPSSSSSSSSSSPGLPQRGVVELKMVRDPWGNSMEILVPTLLNIPGLIAYANRLARENISKLSEEQRNNRETRKLMRGSVMEQTVKLIQLGTLSLMSLFGTLRNKIELYDKDESKEVKKRSQPKSKGRAKKKRNDNGEDETLGEDGEYGIDLDGGDDDDDEEEDEENDDDRKFIANNKEDLKPRKVDDEDEEEEETEDTDYEGDDEEEAEADEGDGAEEEE